MEGSDIGLTTSCSLSSKPASAAAAATVPSLDEAIPGTSRIKSKSKAKSARGRQQQHHLQQQQQQQQQTQEQQAREQSTPAASTAVSSPATKLEDVKPAGNLLATEDKQMKTVTAAATTTHNNNGSDSRIQDNGKSSPSSNDVVDAKKGGPDRDHACSKDKALQSSGESGGVTILNGLASHGGADGSADQSDKSSSNGHKNDNDNSAGGSGDDEDDNWERLIDTGSLDKSLERLRVKDKRANSEMNGNEQESSKDQTKKADSRKSGPIKVHVQLEESSRTTATSSPPMFKILRRETATSGTASATSCTTNRGSGELAGETGNSYGRIGDHRRVVSQNGVPTPPAAKSLAQRQEEYARARLRILGCSGNVGGPPTPVITTSQQRTYNGPQSAPKSALGNVGRGALLNSNDNSVSGGGARRGSYPAPGSYRKSHAQAATPTTTTGGYYYGNSVQQHYPNYSSTTTTATNNNSINNNTSSSTINNNNNSAYVESHSAGGYSHVSRHGYYGNARYESNLGGGFQASYGDDYHLSGAAAATAATAGAGAATGAHPQRSHSGHAR